MSNFRHYGIDAPYVPLTLFIVGLAVTLIGIWALPGGGVWAYVLLLYGLFFFVSIVIYLHTTLRGKFILGKRIFHRFPVPPDARLLDLGCGRGAVLLMDAKTMGPRGRAVGIDLWKSQDQSGNSIDVAKDNAMWEGVSQHVEFVTGDMPHLPFDDHSFDYVTASFSIHNIKSKEGQTQAIQEAYRVLRKGGTMVIADFRSIDEYVTHMTSAGMNIVHTYGAG